MTDRMTPPLLSILITTYNRVLFLDQCFESLKKSLLNSKVKDDIEIIVLNNGSTDDTAETINQFKNILPLRVLREEVSLGFEKGSMKCIDSAEGRYCWFLGDDDYVVLDCLDNLIEYIEKTVPDILLLNHFFYIFENGKKTFLKKSDNRYLMKKSKVCYVDYVDYILDAKHNNAFFTHIAPVIFRRELWYQHFSKEAKEKYVRAHSHHTHVLMSVLKNSSKICYFREQILALGFASVSGNKRGEWSFTEDERFYRFELDVVHFTALFGDVFKEKKLMQHIKDVMLKGSILILLLGSKIRGHFSCRFYTRIFRLFFDCYKTHPFFWYGIIPVLMTPRIIFASSYRLFLKIKG